MSVSSECCVLLARGLRRADHSYRGVKQSVLWCGGAWMSFLIVVCCQIEVSASGSSLVQKSNTECGMFNECDREAR
jgi:hypothetical protein